MKSFMISLLSLCLVWNTYAQNSNYASLKPADLVAEAKTARNSALTINAFSTSQSAERNTIQDNLEDIGDYQLLTLDLESLQEGIGANQDFIQLQIPTPFRSDLEVELVEVNLFDADFTITKSSTNTAVIPQHGKHYRGIVKGDNRSVVSFSIFEDEVMGIISSDATGNLVVGRVQQPNATVNDYIIYNDDTVFEQEGFYCTTPDDGAGYTAEELRDVEDNDRNVGDCVRIYFEVDHDIFLDKGGVTQAANYITAIFNETATLYANENVSVVISEIYVWDTPSPYAGNSSGQLLTQFQANRNGFNGDLAQLISYQASGGIAVLNGLCHPYEDARMSFASVNSTFNTIPTYSFSVMVMTHELGHLLGSNHTHACVWNGNNTAIDGCAGFTEGNCGNPGYPSNGGTIMSYCHITTAGINFNHGFGTQPGNVIRNKIANATCLQPCSNGGGGSNGGGNNGGGDNGGTDEEFSCDNNTVYLNVVLDDYATENTWEITNAAGTVLAEGGNYDKAIAGTIIRDTLCLPDGCYTLTVYDTYGDGMCCEYGPGAYSLSDVAGNILGEGGEFTTEEASEFCLPYVPSSNEDCTWIDFNEYTINSYGVNQDKGIFQLQNDNQELYMTNNAWKAIDFEYEITPNTVIEFEFMSTNQGEIHGLGFDTDDNISYDKTFKVHGSQTWGITTYDTYADNGQWQSFSIPVGQHYVGIFDRLFFVADHDSGLATGNGTFRNIRIHEGDGCGSNLPGQGANNIQQTPINIFPNPANNFINLEYQALEGESQIEIISLLGESVEQQMTTSTNGNNTLQIPTQSLPDGTYMVKITNNGELTTQKFTITH